MIHHWWAREFANGYGVCNCCIEQQEAPSGIRDKRSDSSFFPLNWKLVWWHRRTVFVTAVICNLKETSHHSGGPSSSSWSRNEEAPDVLKGLLARLLSLDELRVCRLCWQACVFIWLSLRTGGFYCWLCLESLVKDENVRSVPCDRLHATSSVVLPVLKGHMSSIESGSCKKHSFVKTLSLLPQILSMGKLYSALIYFWKISKIIISENNSLHLFYKYSLKLYLNILMSFKFFLPFYFSAKIPLLSEMMQKDTSKSYLEVKPEWKGKLPHFFWLLKSSVFSCLVSYLSHTSWDSKCQYKYKHKSPSFSGANTKWINNGSPALLKLKEPSLWSHVWIRDVFSLRRLVVSFQLWSGL